METECAKKWRLTHKGERQRYKQRWYQEHREQQLAHQRKWYHTHKQQAREHNKKYRLEHKEHVKEYRKMINAKVKREVLGHYSSDRMSCACCGEGHIEFLSIDHINNDGAQQRKAFVGARSIYWWLKAREFPNGYRVLCYNCNLSLGHHGYCPHQIKEEKSNE